MNWLLIPGWATDASIFLPYHSLINSAFKSYSWDFSREARSQDEEILSGLEDDYGILCYSMGTLKAIELAERKNPRKIIIIGGFSSFCGNKQLKRRRQKTVNLMLQSFKRSPEKTLNDFFKNSQLMPRQIETENYQNLSSGLELLRDADYSEVCRSLNLDIHLIQGIQDAIVPEAVSQQLLNGPGKRTLDKIEGGHGAIENNIEEMSLLLSKYL